MAKTNYSKIEVALDRALQKIFIDRLSELANIADIINESQAHISSKMIEDMVIRFQKELSKIKNQDPKLYAKLKLSETDEVRFYQNAHEYLNEDWIRLKELKVKINDLKRELDGTEEVVEKNQKLVEEERKLHVNKRHKVREGWLPLH